MKMAMLEKSASPFAFLIQDIETAVDYLGWAGYF